MLFAITMINYMDHNILGVLKPTIQGDLHFTETDFGSIIIFFSIAYAIGYAGMGWLTDKIGIRLGLAAAAIVWCAASTAHGLVSSVAGFILARILLGLGEGGNFPTCVKTVATWFPVRDRALATGIFNCGSNIGAMPAPLIGALVGPPSRAGRGGRPRHDAGYCFRGSHAAPRLRRSGMDGDIPEYLVRMAHQLEQ